jgi:hypothetical protein
LTNFISTLLPVIGNSGFVETLSITFDDSGSLKTALRIGRRGGFANNQLGDAIGKVMKTAR